MWTLTGKLACELLTQVSVWDPGQVLLLCDDGDEEQARAEDKMFTSVMVNIVVSALLKCLFTL